MDTPTLYDILSQKLEQKCKEHPSFRLMKIDDRLFPNAQTKHSTLVLEARNSNDELKTVAKIVAESWEKGDKNHLMIEGEGGIGKTVTLLSIPDKFTPFPVPAIYIPLHELPQGDDPIERYIKKRVLSNKEDLYGQLLYLLEKPWDKGPQLLLLLDGFNEIAAEKRPTISEDIKYWSEFQGIQIVTSSRYDIHTYVALSYDNSAIKLQPLSNTTVDAYLKSMKVRIPTDSAVKELITIPLLLTLYVKTELILEQRETDSAEFREAKNAGSIVWNYLQCELWHFGKEDQDAKNAIIAMEFIAPYMAWQMQQNSMFIMDKKDFHKFLDDAYTLLKNHFNKPDDFPFQIKDVLQKADGIPPLENIRNLLEKQLCLFVKNGNSYRLMHQQFRDVLAAMHLINLSYLSGNSLPQEWNSPIDFYVLRFVVDLISEEEADRLWEQCRKTTPAIDDATRNQLRLQGLLHNNDFSHLDFSGLDLSDISLYLYRYSQAIIKLPTQQARMVKTKISDKTFSPVGHKGSVSTLAVTPNGKRIVSGSEDHTIRVWDLETGAAIGNPIEGHEGWVRIVAVTQDGNRIVSDAWDHTIRIWNMETGAAIGNPFEGYEDGVTAIALTPDGKCIVSGSWDGTIRVWDMETGTAIGKPIKGHKGWVNNVAVTPDGKRIVSGSDDRTIRIWDMETGAAIGEPIKGHEGGVTAIAVTLDRRRIVSGSDDRTIHVWNLENGAAIGKPIEGHEYGVNTVAVTPDGKRIISGSYDSTIRVWDMETGTAIGNPIKGHKYSVNAIAVTPDGKRIVSGSWDRTIRVWDIETGVAIGDPIEGYEDRVRALAMTPDGKRIIIGSANHTIRVWDMEACAAIGDPIEGHEDWMRAVAVTPNGKCIVSGSLDGTIRVWDIEIGALIGNPIKGHKDRVTAIALTPDGKRIVSGSDDSTIRIWNLETGAALGNPIKRHQNSVRALVVTPDWKRIVSGSDDSTIRIWDLETGAAIGEPIKGHENQVYAVAVMPNGKCIVSGSFDGTFCITDIETREVKRIKVHPLSFVGLDFSKALFSTPELKETLRQNGAKVDPD